MFREVSSAQLQYFVSPVGSPDSEPAGLVARCHAANGGGAFRRQPKMAEVVCARNSFQRNDAKPILQATVPLFIFINI